ncbi:MAG: hypothetical protein HY064_12825 [Bacteroidetes bacterium]|nr:hypothetical protein [Bacteroidota bacterium]
MNRFNLTPRSILSVIMIVLLAAYYIGRFVTGNDHWYNSSSSSSTKSSAMENYWKSKTKELSGNIDGRDIGMLLYVDSNRAYGNYYFVDTNGVIKITSGDGNSVSGTFSDTTKTIWYTVSGIVEDSNFFLYELDSARTIMGTFRGKFIDEDEISGYYLKNAAKDSVLFKLSNYSYVKQ